MIKINVITKNYNWLKYIKRPNNYLDQKIDKLNLQEKKFNRVQIFCTLLLSGDKEIKYLNNKFRKKNISTDVLSFPFQTKKELENLLKREKEIYLGDIVININKIKNKDFKSEFDCLWIHGLLHLFGYDHKKKKIFSVMRAVEQKYFNLINA